MVALRLGTDHAPRVDRLVLATVSFHQGACTRGCSKASRICSPNTCTAPSSTKSACAPRPTPGGWPNLVRAQLHRRAAAQPAAAAPDSAAAVDRTGR